MVVKEPLFVKTNLNYNGTRLLVKCVCVHCFFPLFSFVPSRWCHYGDYKFKIQMISLSTGPSQARMKVEITKLALGCSVGVSEKLSL